MSDDANRPGGAGNGTSDPQAVTPDEGAENHLPPPRYEEGPFPDADATPPPSRDEHAAGHEPATSGGSIPEQPAPPAAGTRRIETAQRDSAASAEAPPRSELQEHLLSKSTWLRFLYVVLFLILWALSRVVVGAVVVLQFLWLLFTGATNPRLTYLGQTLATYSYQLVLYLTFATDRQPFPFDDWPTGPPRGS